MFDSPSARRTLIAASGVTLAFLYLPLLVVALYAFNESRAQRWPIAGLTLRWWGEALRNDGARQALLMSLKAATLATLVALVLGTLAAFAVQRYSFFGRDTVSFLVILPIALPGIVTGMALNASFTENGLSFGLMTIVIGHATFCVVTVYNNVLARLRRVSRSLEEASADLGADPLQTFRHVTFPAVRSALLAGALLSFALSFDEVIVTTFTAGGDQTLPIWILNNLSRPNQLPVVNVVAVVVLLLSMLPVYLAQRITEGVGERTVGAGYH